MTVKVHGFDGMPARLRDYLERKNNNTQSKPEQKETEPMAKLLTFEELMGTGQPTKADVDKAIAEKTKPAPAPAPAKPEAEAPAPEQDNKPIIWNDLISDLQTQTFKPLPKVEQPKIEWHPLTGLSELGLDLAEVSFDGETDLADEAETAVIEITAPAGTVLLVKVNGMVFVPAQ